MCNTSIVSQELTSPPKPLMQDTTEASTNSEILYIGHLITVPPCLVFADAPPPLQHHMMRKKVTLEFSQ